MVDLDHLVVDPIFICRISTTSISLRKMISEILALLLTIVIALYTWVQRNYNYWNKKNVPFIKPDLFFGNIKDMILGRNGSAIVMEKLYKAHESSPIVGIYVLNKPALLIRDPELIKKILVKDFNKFPNRYAASDPYSDGLGANSLFFVKNFKWKQIRSKLSPVFSSGKLKQISVLIEEVNGFLKIFRKFSSNSFSDRF